MSDTFLIPFMFDGEPIDMVMLEDGKTVGFTTHHLAIVFGMEEKYINQVLTRNRELFDDMTFGCTMQLAGKSRRYTCLTREGVISLIMALDYKRFDEDRKTRVLAFKKWVSKVATEVMSGDISDELVTWLAERKLAKLLYRTLTDAVKEKYINDAASDKEKRMIYGREANLINLVVFGTKANGVNRRNTATSDQLRCLNKCQGVLPGLVLGNVPYDRRLEILQEVVDKLVIESEENKQIE